MDTLHQADLGEMPALGRTDVESIWMYAACDEFSSRAIAEAGLEVRIGGTERTMTILILIS